MNERLITQQTWDTLADWYENNFLDEPLYHFSYDLLCERLVTKNSQILELGCGPGNISKYLLSKRPDFKITCTDYSDNMLRLVKKNCPNVSVKKMDINALASIEQQFHGIVAGFCLPYLSMPEVETFLRHATDKLLPGGQLYISFIVGDYEKSGLKTNSSGQQALQYYYSVEYLREKLIDLSFKKLAVLPMTHLRAGKKPEQQNVLIASR